ncbi:hypothetical protein SBA3_360001 [Candidatus Sulfopaludibacter sp. SbA3]|nr:hypothetical protein SBA3_360001 [Candidatus Sulfopaludibacter sp. SbA3]
MARAHREFDRRQDRRRYQVLQESQVGDATGCVGTDFRKGRISRNSGNWCVTYLREKRYKPVQ